jgi:DNA-binding response OmpR family regulator
MADEARRRILVVTDDDHVATEAKFGLRGEVTRVDDARAAWRTLKRFTPALVIVDLQTGSAGGFSLARDMAADRRLARVPVLMLLERPQDAWLAAQAGASAHLVKPLAAAELAAAVAGLLAA